MMGLVVFMGGLGTVFSVIFGVVKSLEQKAYRRGKLLKQLNQTLQQAAPMPGQIMEAAELPGAPVQYAIAAKGSDGVVYRVDFPMQLAISGSSAVGMKTAMRQANQPLTPMIAQLNTPGLRVTKADPPLAPNLVTDNSGCILMESDCCALHEQVKKQIALCRGQKVKYGLMSAGAGLTAALLWILTIGLSLE